MADEDVEVVRCAYAAYSKGVLAAAGSVYSEDTVWDVSRFLRFRPTRCLQRLARAGEDRHLARDTGLEAFVLAGADPSMWVSGWSR